MQRVKTTCPTISENDDVEQEFPVLKSRKMSSFEHFASTFDTDEKAQLCFKINKQVS